MGFIGFYDDCLLNVMIPKRGGKVKFFVGEIQSDSPCPVANRKGWSARVLLSCKSQNPENPDSDDKPRLPQKIRVIRDSDDQQNLYIPEKNKFAFLN